MSIAQPAGPTQAERRADPRVRPLADGERDERGDERESDERGLRGQEDDLGERASSVRIPLLPRRAGAVGLRGFSSLCRRRLGEPEGLAGLFVLAAPSPGGGPRGSSFAVAFAGSSRTARVKTARALLCSVWRCGPGTRSRVGEDDPEHDVGASRGRGRVERRSQPLECLDCLEARARLGVRGALDHVGEARPVVLVGLSSVAARADPEQDLACARRPAAASRAACGSSPRCHSAWWAGSRSPRRRVPRARSMAADREREQRAVRGRCRSAGVPVHVPASQRCASAAAGTARRPRATLRARRRAATSRQRRGMRPSESARAPAHRRRRPRP